MQGTEAARLQQGLWAWLSRAGAVLGQRWAVAARGPPQRSLQPDATTPVTVTVTSSSPGLQRS